MVRLPSVVMKAPILAFVMPVLAAAALSPAKSAAPHPPPLERPPQFLVMSFDGAGTVDLWRHWRAIAKKSGAHFTFFLSGVYLLEPEHAAEYHSPDRVAGVSSIGFLPVPKGARSEPTLRALIAEIDGARAEGHEIGTHFNGHFCGDHGATVWDVEDWRTEIDEFRRLLREVDANNRLDPPSAMVLGSAAIVGARVPCLDSDRHDLEAALASTGFRYDASRPGLAGEWPRVENGLWSFPVPPLSLADAPHPVLATDYNLWQHHASAGTPERAAAIERETYDALMAAFDESYYGKRAPFAVSSHFEHWNREAYLNALGHFLRDACARPETRCESFESVVDWLDAQPDLARLRHGDFPRAHRG